MATKEKRSPVSNGFHIRRVRKDVYHVTDTTQNVECRVIDPSPFRATKRVVIRPKERKEADLDHLTQGLLIMLEDEKLK